MTAIMTAAAGGFLLGVTASFGVAAIVAAYIWKDIRG